DLAQRDLQELRMPQALPEHAAVAAAHNQGFARPAVGEQRHVRHHLVVDELVLGGELHDRVEHHHPAKVGIFEDDQTLVLGLAIEEDAVRGQSDTEATVERLFDPAVHRFISLPRRCSLTTTLRGEKASFRISIAARGLVSPHMNTSSAAYPYSGQLWMEMCDSARTATPETPPLGVKWWRWICSRVAPAPSRQRRSVCSMCSRSSSRSARTRSMMR